MPLIAPDAQRVNLVVPRAGADGRFIASFWSIADATSAALISTFYRRLAVGDAGRRAACCDL